MFLEYFALLLQTGCGSRTAIGKLGQCLQFVCIFFLMNIDVYVSFFCNV